MFSPYKENLVIRNFGSIRLVLFIVQDAVEASEE